MKQTNKLAAITAMSMALTAATAKAAPPEPVRVGIVDVHANTLTFEDRGTRIEYREFKPEGTKSARWLTEAGFDHGQAVASAFVRQIRLIDADAPIEIYAANPMYQKPEAQRMYSLNTTRDARISIDFEGAQQALRWFKENKVTVVLTTMNGADNGGMRSFMAEAKRLGMVVFASAGNSPTAGRVYPAAYDEAIAVAADNKGLALDRNPEVSTWVQFAMDGAISKGRSGRVVSEGSSFAVAKAAAFASFGISRGSPANRSGAMDVLNGLARQSERFVGGQKVSFQTLDEVDGARALRSPPSKPEGVGHQPSTAGRLAAMAAGLGR